MNDKEEKYQSIIEKIAQTSGESIEDVRKGYDEIIMTNNVNTEEKDKANSRIQREQQELIQAQENQEQLE